MNSQRTWWVPIWSGLIMEEKGKHYRMMGSSLWLFLYLALHADRRTGFLLRKVKTISKDTGIKPRTAREWLRVLKQQGYIETRTTGRCLLIQIRKWKGFGEWQDNVTQGDKSLPTRVAEECHSEAPVQDQNSSQISENSHSAPDPNDTLLNKIIKKRNVMAFKEETLPSVPVSVTHSRQRSEQDLLALQIAREFNDLKNLGLYLSYCREYPRDLIVDVYQAVKDTPSEKIRKTRGALFTYLVNHHAQESKALKNHRA